VLGGFLARCGLSQSWAATFVEAVGAASLQPGDKRRDMARTARDGASAERRAGFPLLAETFGEGSAKKVADWLDYAGAREQGEGEARPAARRGVRANLSILENLTMTPIEWIWEGCLAKGAIHLIAGVPEAGKTSIALMIAAIVSSGERWPDGTRAAAGHTIIWTGEDDPARTIKPRLVQMGANAKRISIVKGMPDEDGQAPPVQSLNRPPRPDPRGERHIWRDRLAHRRPHRFRDRRKGG
jgi:hypothetical protein